MTRVRKEMIKKSIAILVLLLLINLPVVSALELSNVQAQSITENSALITWQTDEKADSFVNYGLEKENLLSVGDANKIIDHKFLLSGLTSDTTYYYSVESNDIVDNQEGELYSFTTLPPDTTIPELNAEIPTAIQGGRLNLAGTTEIGAEISLFINNLLLQTITADDGSFEFQGILLQANQANAIRLDVVDQAGNQNSLSGTIFADTEKPTIKLPELPEYIDGNSFVLKAPVSEGVSVEIFVNDRSVWKDEEVSEIDKNLALQEGKNKVKIVLTDGAGWETIGEFTIISDTRPPQVSFELEKGLEYYEGRAETNINGKTEPGATVYLYVFRGFGDEYKANFKRALAKQTADEEGEFTFKDISFPPSPFDMSLKELAPREVPSGLQEVVVSPLSRLSEEQRKSYKVYVIAEDKSGKSGYAQKTVNINSCFSADQAFDVTLIPQFQAPFKLNPGLMEEGRESIQSVFNITYRGGAVAPINPATNRPEEAYKISTVRFQKACTQSMLDDDEFKYGCQLMPSSFREQSNVDHTSYYVTANLNRADEFIDKEDNVWDDFQKRQLKMPLKVTINYQERDEKGSWDQRKTQTFCYDLGYFVDIPIESADMIPDFLADEGVDALNWTIEQIEMLKPYLETAMLVTGISCIGSFLVKMIARFYRNFMSNFEPWLTRLKLDDRCPGVKGQNELYLDDTINHWQNDLSGHPDVKGSSALPEDLDKKSLSKKCPSTSTAWNVESYVDLAYRYTCDRFLCRSVPAGWTQKASEEEIKEVVAEQKMCAASSGSCSFLEEVENCQEKIDASAAKVLDADNLIQRKGRTFSCYLNRENGLFYTVNRAPNLEEDRHIWLLKPENAINKVGTLTQPDLLAYRPPGTEQICVAKDLSCESQCNRKSGYQAVRGEYDVSDGILQFGPQDGSCYKEVQEGESVELRDVGGDLLKEGRVAADYTKDCFVDKNTGDKFQCVCEPSKKETSTQLKGAREAVKKVGEQEEEWQYQQDRVFAESKGTAGTHYSKLRYYSGRDFSGAFGASYGLDNFRNKDFKTTEVNPHTQLLGTFQSMCIPGIYARLQLLESILIGLRNCIIEAKYTGFQDAGMCKTIFTQYVCGLIYKGISYLASDCSPISFSDLGKGETVGGVEAFFASGTKAIPQTLDSSISEIKEDYGNAQLDQFFASGSQGFAESLCLAAFGYDFPIDMDFIMDTAYAFPTATNVIFPIADRELSTFDPLKGTAVFNYNLGGTILPGCKIRSYRTTLKCIGPNDLGKAGIDCTQQKCDCMDISEDASAFESQKTYVVQGGVGTGLSKGQMFDMPIPSPQKVSSAYRYDHVVLELNLAQGEDPEQCFDKEYRTSNGGLFYFPIRDISPPTIAACQASLSTGKFSCPQLTDFFASGGSYFEHPFVRCFDRRKDEYVRCDQANVFIANDPIVIKPQLNLGKSKACLKIEGNGINMPPQPLPEGLTGSYTPAITIGSVSQGMITGGSVGTIVPVGGNDPGCGGGDTIKELEVLSKPSDPSNLKPTNLKFTYQRQDDKYKMTVVTDGVKLEDNSGYTLPNGVVTGNTGEFLSAEDLNSLKFEFKGFQFTKVLGIPTPTTGDSGQCTYQARFPRLGASGGTGSLSVTMKLLQPVGDDCYLAETPIPTSSLGLNVHTENIRIQSEPVEETYAQGLEQDFLNGNYDLVIAKAEGVVKRDERSLADARALFYWIGSFVMQDDGLVKHNNNILSLLDTFFSRNYGEEVTSTGEYQKIEVYLTEVANKVNKKINYDDEE